MSEEKVVKFDGKLTISIGQEVTRIWIEDVDAGVRFCDVQIATPEFARGLSSLAMRPCEVEVRGADLVGKKQEWKPFRAEVEGRGFYGKEAGREAVIEQCPEGWVPDLYLDSHGTFETDFEKNKTYINTTIRRWVEEEDDGTGEG